MDIFFEEENFNHLRLFLEKGNYTKKHVFILLDTGTAIHCLPVLKSLLPGFTFVPICIPEGEKNKNLNSCELIWEALTAGGCNRESLLINLGGGIVTDTGGFAASVFKRGIRFINIPTTLLAMVDAAIGGKTGIDFKHIKNHLGTFCMPEALFIYPGFLATLDERTIKSGISEMIKHALIADSVQWQNILQTEENYFYTPDAIRKSAEVKINITEADPFEKNKRKLLNFGHTIGHAFESYSLKHDSNYLIHGEAIAMGMLCESWLSKEIVGLADSDFEKIKTVILKYFKKYPVEKAQFEEIIHFAKQDKKNRDNSINFSLLNKPGQSVFDVFVDEKSIEKVFNWYIAL